MREAIRLKGMPVMVAALFCYTAIETTSALWASSYITIRKGLPDDVGALGTTFLFLGMTVGRFASGFISDRLGDKRMMHIGQALIAAGSLALFLLSGRTAVLASMAVLGFGCAPVFPCFIHYVPQVFGIGDTGSAVSLLDGQFAARHAADADCVRLDRRPRRHGVLPVLSDLFRGGHDGGAGLPEKTRNGIKKRRRMSLDIRRRIFIFRVTFRP